ncbi:hypothetical protein Tco_1524699, partial [Tanacetum coccineum]
SDAALSCEPTVSPLNDNKIDFRISFDESDDEDYTPEVSYSNDLDFFKDYENEFPAFVYNDALTSKSDFLTEPTEQNVLYFNDLFPFGLIYPDDLKSGKDNDIDEIDIEQSSGDMSVVPLPNVINTDDGAYALRNHAAYPRVSDTRKSDKTIANAKTEDDSEHEIEGYGRIPNESPPHSHRPDIVIVVCMCLGHWIALTTFADADYTGCQDSMKSTSGTAQFLVQHSRMKHIAVRYHFIKEQGENEIVELYFIKTAYQLVDIFNKALARERFEFLVKRLGMQSITPEELKLLAEEDEE